MSDDLLSALSTYDGKTTSQLTQIAAEFGGDPDYMKNLLAACVSHKSSLAVAATWLIRDHLRHGGLLTPSQTEALIKTTPHLDDWQALLHLGQMTRALIPSRNAANLLASEMMALLDHPRPFLRAWSMDALAHLADLFPDHQDRAKAAVIAGLADEASSVRARARELH